MNPNVNALASDGLIPCDLEAVEACLADVSLDIEYHSIKLRLAYIMRGVLLEKKESLEVEKK